MFQILDWFYLIKKFNVILFINQNSYRKDFLKALSNLILLYVVILKFDIGNKVLRATIINGHV